MKICSTIKMIQVIAPK